MTHKRTHSEKTSAADKAIGFDYQYYYFLYRLLILRSNETIGLEVKDDVHIKLPNDNLILIQLKHTVQNDASGNPTNFTTYCPDLWKTLYNWSKVIKDKNDNRAIVQNQQKFIESTEFILVSNKSSNKENLFLKILNELKSGTKKYTDCKAGIEALKRGTTDKDIIKYISNVLSLDDTVLNCFFNRLNFNLDQNDVIDKCKLSIVEKMIPLSKSEDVFAQLDSHIRQDNFYKIKLGEKIEISFSDFHKKYRRIFDLARNQDLIIRSFNEELPANLEDQTFIKQLVDICDIEKGDFESISEFSRHKIKMMNNFSQWLQEGELVQKEKEDFEENAINIWRNIYRSCHRVNGADEFNRNALSVIDKLRQEKLKIDKQELATDMSNGEYYSLSDDEPRIGWHKDWEKKYK